MDLHCHLDLYPEALKLLPEVNRRNDFTLVVTTSPRAWIATSKVFAGYENIKIAVGLHPEIAERKASELDLLVSSIAKAEFVGEVGLDGSQRFKASLPLQEKIFSAAIAECELQGGRIISLHSRGAATRVLDILERHPEAGFPILHWFSGTISELKRAVALDCWFSVGPAMLAAAKGRDLLNRMPINRVLPETDGPFAAVAGVSLMPWQSQEVLPVLSQTWGITEEEARAQITDNLSRLLAL